jgi:hypothetical protein
MEILQGPLDLSVKDRPFEKNFKIDEKLYAFLDMTKLTVGELSDMDTLRAMPSADKLLHKMMAILYRPAKVIAIDWIITDAYTLDGFEERAELFKEKMKVKTVLGAINFFFHITRYSFESMMDSSVEKAKKMGDPIMMEATLAQRDLMLELLEVGLSSSILSQGTMHSELKKLLVSQSHQLLTTSPTEKTKQKEKRWRMTDLFAKWKTKN